MDILTGHPVRLKTSKNSSKLGKKLMFSYLEEVFPVQESTKNHFEVGGQRRRKKREK